MSSIKSRGTDMTISRFLSRISPLAALLVAGIPSPAQVRDVLKSAEIDGMFSAGAASREVLSKPNFAIDFRSTGASGSSARDAEADEFWFVRHGAANLSLNSTSYQAAAGDV